MVHLQQAVLQWPKLFEFLLKQLALKVGNGFLVKNQRLGYVVGENLDK